MNEFEEIDTVETAPVRRVGAILAGVVLSAVVIFSLGVMVGKRVAESVPRFSEPPSALPTENLEAVPLDAMGKGGEGLRQETSGGGGGGDRPADKLTFFDTLPDDKAPVPKAPPGTPVKPEKTVAAPARTTVRKVPPAPVPSRQTPAPTAPPDIRRLGGPGPFFIQVSSTTNRDWADDLVRRLKTEGVDAKPTAVTLNGKQWYRIRVGSFPDRERAQQARVILKKMGHDGMIVRGD